jgi:hypothetical protein
MRSKWDVLLERRDAAVAALVKAQCELDGLTATRCDLRCAGCDELLETEADFAKHFVLKNFDIQLGLLNLGVCPNQKYLEGS